MSDTSNNQTAGIFPDELEMGDRVEFDGNEYEVVGTGPGEATLERLGDMDYKAEVFRWAFTDSVGIELEASFTQSEFGEMVTKDQ